MLRLNKNYIQGLRGWGMKITRPLTIKDYKRMLNGQWKNEKE